MQLRLLHKIDLSLLSTLCPVSEGRQRSSTNRHTIVLFDLFQTPWDPSLAEVRRYWNADAGGSLLAQRLRLDGSATN
jgi:hypothetical protein